MNRTGTQRTRRAEEDRKEQGQPGSHLLTWAFITIADEGNRTLTVSLGIADLPVVTGPDLLVGVVLGGLEWPGVAFVILG
jgi:hypothetical protein